MEAPDSPARFALVTGGGRGIGAVIAAHLAADGYEVVITGRTETDLSTTAQRCGAHWIVSNSWQRSAERRVSP